MICWQKIVKAKWGGGQLSPTLNSPDRHYLAMLLNLGNSVLCVIPIILPCWRFLGANKEAHKTKPLSVHAGVGQSWDHQSHFGISPPSGTSLLTISVHAGHQRQVLVESRFTGSLLIIMSYGISNSGGRELELISRRDRLRKTCLYLAMSATVR